MLTYSRNTDGTLAITGLSTDTKPLKVDSVVPGGKEPVMQGSTFFEINTSSVYMFDAAGNTWRKL